MLSKEPEKESWNTTPWRLLGKLGLPLTAALALVLVSALALVLALVAGVDLGDVCGDTKPKPRGICDASAAPLTETSAGSGVTALTVCRNAPPRVLADGLSASRGDGASESGGSIEAWAGRSGKGGATTPRGLLPKE